jgi:dynein heavy chain
MVDSFEFIVMAGDPLFCVANTMKKLYLPVIERGLAECSGLPDLDESLKHELTSNLSKFEQQLRLTTSTRGDNKLYVPNIVISNPEAVVDDYETVVQIEAAIKDWTAHMQAAVEHEHQKVSRHGSPLSEIEFWRERSTSLSTVYEQLTTPKAQQMIQVLKLMENQNLVLFQFNFSELSKLYLEAKDNVKFLSTLERHFKHIEKGTFNTSTYFIWCSYCIVHLIIWYSLG